MLGFGSDLGSLDQILDSSLCGFSGDLVQEKTAGFVPWAAVLLPTLSCYFLRSHDQNGFHWHLSSLSSVEYFSEKTESPQ